MSFLVDNNLENSDFLSELMRITAAELPEPKPQAPKKSKVKKE